MKLLTSFMVALMFVQTCFVGCISNTVEPQKNADEQVADVNPTALASTITNDAANCVGGTPLLSIKPNGTAVDVQSAWIEGNSVLVCYSYQSTSGPVVERLLDLNRSLLQMTVYDANGIALVGHEYELLSDSIASYRVWSGRDQFLLKVAATDDSVTFSLSDGTVSTTISGAIETFAAERGELLSNAIGDYAEFASGEEDLVTAEYLLAEEEFLKYIYSEFGYDIDDSTRRAKLCGVAGLICNVCTFLSECPPCWIVCVPACGIAIACAIADIFE